MDSERHHFYFSVAIVVIFAVAAFVSLEVVNTSSDIALLEGSLLSIVKSNNSRLSNEINRSAREIDLYDLDSEIQFLDSEIDNL